MDSPRRLRGFSVGDVDGEFLRLLLIGLALPWMVHEHHRLYVLVVVGFLGAFTTFSTYSLDTLLQVGLGKPSMALLNAVGPVVLGFGFVWLGVQAARLLGAHWL